MQMKINKIDIFFFCCLAFYKLAIDIGFRIILTNLYPIYSLNFNVYKYVLGWFCSIIIYILIEHKQKRVSTFFIYLIYLLQFIPITTIFGYKNESTIYYLFLFFGFVMCIFLVNHTHPPKLIKSSVNLSRIMMFAGALLSVLFMTIVFRKNGLPSLTALNLYDVYELRRGTSFQLGHYTNEFIFPFVISVYLPILIAKTIHDKRYWISLFACITMFLIYLYTGYKTFLFSMALVVLLSFWSKRPNVYMEFFSVFCIAIMVLTIGVIIIDSRNICSSIYNFIVRRSLIVPADLKFIHYDYFSNHPKLGIFGVLPLMLMLSIPKYYTRVIYPFEIGEIYFNSPLMSADTGALAEGYARFGYVGIIIEFLLITLILKLSDSFQERTDYSFAVGTLIYAFYSLSEGQIIGTLFLGQWMFYIIFMLFYISRDKSCMLGD